MAEVSVRWRPSGNKEKPSGSSTGRGEWEYTPASSLKNRKIVVKVAELGLELTTGTYGSAGSKQGKPRVRFSSKSDANSKQKLHLVPLVMAVARLADPMREDKGGPPQWPLMNKRFLVSEMRFEVLEDDGTTVKLRPISASILHSEKVFDLRQRFSHIANDIAQVVDIETRYPKLGQAIRDHQAAMAGGQNTTEIRKSADHILELQSEEFGETNAAAITTIEELPESELEQGLGSNVKGKEGRWLTRQHSYRERRPEVVKEAKKLFKAKHKRLHCECCGIVPGEFYGPRGEDRIHGHHRVPVSELLPDTETSPEDLAMVCPNCHDIIHAEKPEWTVEALRAHLLARGQHYFSTHQHGAASAATWTVHSGTANGGGSSDAGSPQPEHGGDQGQQHEAGAASP